MEVVEYATLQNWYGSYYELGIAYAPHVGGQRPTSALAALWNHPLLEGPVAGPYHDSLSPLTPVPFPPTLENMNALYGFLRIPQRRTVGCLTWIISESDGPIPEVAQRHIVSVILAIPTGMLDLAYPVAYPIVGATNPWIDEFEHILLRIAETVYQAAPFDLAVVGEEAAALSVEEQALTPDIVDRGGYLLSPHLARRIHPHREPEVLPTGLRWFPWAT